MTPNASTKARNIHICVAGAKRVPSSTGISVVPVMCHIASSAISMNSEPPKVNRKNFSEAATRFSPPQMPISRLDGISVASKNT